jgi:hypothetical protein
MYTPSGGLLLKLKRHSVQVVTTSIGLYGTMLHFMPACMDGIARAQIAALGKRHLLSSNRLAYLQWMEAFEPLDGSSKQAHSNKLAFRSPGRLKCH